MPLNSAPSSAYEQLRTLLREQAILYSSADNPVQLPDKRQAPWMFYSWGTTMTSTGMRLVAECMLDRLRTFDSTQIASHGYTSVPILAATVMLGEGHYTGMFVREKRKSYGSMRRIDGLLDRSRSVVVIDDSIASGKSVLTAIDALESEGVRVEGALGLVGFPHGGLEKLRALGYRAEVLFDIYEDIGMQQSQPYVPVHERLMPPAWGTRRIEDGLHPATAARRIAEAYLRDGEVPLPPTRFDRDYDGHGGVFVSFRQRHSDYRVGRDGFWHFEPRDADACRDVVLATVRTVSASQGAISEQTLPDLKINVSFFTALENIPPAKLNFWTHGIVVRSRQNPSKMGGALPNTQVFSDEVEQYRHARQTNGRLMLHEAHDIFRHGIDKCVEPGESWLAYGFPYERDSDWGRDDKIGAALTKRAIEFLQQCEGGKVRGKPISDDLVPCPISTVAVTIYHRGILGCSLSWEGSLDDCLRRAAVGAYGDRRFDARRGTVSVSDMTVSVSLLWGQEVLGTVHSDKAAFKMRRGIDSLSVMQGARRAMFLSLVPVYFNWSKQETVRQLLRKAGITHEPAVWATYQTHSWLRTGKSQWKMAFGFTDHAEARYGPEQWRADAALLADYILRQIPLWSDHHTIIPSDHRTVGPSDHQTIPPSDHPTVTPSDHPTVTPSDVLPAYSYDPITGKQVASGTSARVIHALAALRQAGAQLGNAAWREAGRRGLSYCLDHVKPHDERPGAGICALPGRDVSSTTDAILLSALCQEPSLLAHPAAASVARGVCLLLQADGRVAVRPNARGLTAEHDYMPGTVLLALARWVRATGERAWLDGVDAQLEWYARRFRVQHSWGMVGWQTQAWAAIYELTGQARHADFVFEIADWALEQQSEYHGAFLTDLHPYGLSFHTGFLAEGMAAAWRLAVAVGDKQRAQRYERSCRAALRFVQRLYIRAEDTFAMADPALAVGGVRGALAASDVRIDFNSHCLTAALASISMVTT